MDFNGSWQVGPERMKKYFLFRQVDNSLNLHIKYVNNKFLTQSIISKLTSKLTVTYINQLLILKQLVYISDGILTLFRWPKS